MSDTAIDFPGFTVDEALDPAHLRKVVLTHLPSGEIDVEVTCLHDGIEHTGHQPVPFAVSRAFSVDLIVRGWQGAVDQDNRYVFTPPIPDVIAA